MKSLSREEIRLIDHRAINEYGVPSLVLMENAGRGATDIICKLGISGPVVICCGRGNNAGDGLVMARHLDLRGHQVCVVHWTEPAKWTGDPGVHFTIVTRSGIETRQLPSDNMSGFQTVLDEAEWIIDGLLGTGAQGAPRPPYAEAINVMNKAVAKRFAIDIPSGLDCDTGEAAQPTFRADHTCTFVAAKHGLLKSAATPFVGQLHVTDIGAPRQLVAEKKL